jgi:hypothetical protein
VALAINESCGNITIYYDPLRGAARPFDVAEQFGGLGIIMDRDIERPLAGNTDFLHD